MLAGGSFDILEGLDEISEYLRRNHDGIAIASDVLGDFYHHAS